MVFVFIYCLIVVLFFFRIFFNLTVVEPPPLPVSQPPLYVFQRPSSNMSSYTSEDTEDDWHEGN